jgi:hypothetical protein
MAKAPKEQPGGVDPSADPADGAPESQDSGAAVVEVTEALRELTEQDHVDQLLDEVPQMREFIGAYHEKIERLARHFGRDAKMHAKLTRLAHLFAEFRNGLGSV